MYVQNFINNLILLWNEIHLFFSLNKLIVCSLGSLNKFKKSLLTWCAHSKHVLSADKVLAFYTHGASFGALVMFGGAHLTSFPLFLHHLYTHYSLTREWETDIKHTFKKCFYFVFVQLPQLVELVSLSFPIIHDSKCLCSWP